MTLPPQVGTKTTKGDKTTTPTTIITIIMEAESRIQYDTSGQPMIQCRACNLWGHFARDCTTKEMPQVLCRWCGPGNHEDSKCPKQGVNLLSIKACDEKILAITREQAKKARHPDAEEE